MFQWVVNMAVPSLSNSSEKSEKHLITKWSAHRYCKKCTLATLLRLNRWCSPRNLAKFFRMFLWNTYKRLFVIRFGLEKKYSESIIFWGKTRGCETIMLLKEKLHS